MTKAPSVPAFAITEEGAIVPRGAVCYPLGVGYGIRYSSLLHVTDWGQKSLLLVMPDFDWGKRRPSIKDCFGQTIDGLRPLNQEAKELLMRLL